MTKIDPSRVSSLRNEITGDVLLQDDPGYQEAREIWNAMIDKKPAVIVRCASPNDVAPALNFARDNDLTLAIRSGGHNIAGNALCDDGLVIDLSRLTSAHVDADKRIVSIGAGATLKDLDAATLAHGLATPVGINSTTGLAGLTLGGGFGWLSRKHGMTVDNLLSADVVLANGDSVHASAEQHSDLFWALRGGGGNFGVVTQFEFELHPLGPDVLSGLVVYPIEQAKSVLQQYREFATGAPDDLAVWVVARKAPPLPFLPDDVHGKEVVVLALFYAGDPEAGNGLIQPLRTFGDPYGEHIGVQPYVDWQQAFDPLLTPGARNYWKSHNFHSLSDELFDKLIEYVHKLPSPQCEIFIGAIGGATERVASDAMAYPHRDVRFVMNVHGRWDDASLDQKGIGWARDFFEATKPLADSGVYVNFMTEEEGDRIPSAYGENYGRLAEIKRRYDPDNLFHVNHNIKPA